MHRFVSGPGLCAAVAIAVAVGLTGFPAVATAGPRHREPKLVNATGCLAKGDEKGEVWLEMKNGTIYGLEGHLDLQAHLGERVTVRGRVLKEGPEESGEEAREEHRTGRHETADFRVVSLKVLSRTCGS